jgi:hypothetical protein
VRILSGRGGRGTAGDPAQLQGPRLAAPEGRFARRLADAGVRIDFCHLASNSRIVVGLDDVDRAIRTLQLLGR